MAPSHTRLPTLPHAPLITPAPPPSTGELYLTDAIRYATGCLITALLVPPILNEAEALRLGVASNLALVGVEARQRAEREEMEARGERPDEEADKVGRCIGLCYLLHMFVLLQLHGGAGGGSWTRWRTR